MKKSILSSILVTVLVSVCLSSVFAQETDYKDYAELLNCLSVTDINTEALNPEEQVTRTVFADAVASMMNEDIDFYAGSPVGDLTVNDKGMLYLTDLGVMSGYGNDEFLPQRAISTNEALSVILSALGYSATAQAMGGYPKGYVDLAYELDLMDGVSLGADGSFTYADFVRLLVNSLDVYIMEIDAVSGNGNTADVSYGVKNGVTLISKHRDIYKGKGLVAANEISGLYSARECTGKGKVLIDSRIYEDLNGYAGELLGSTVDFYYQENDLTGVTLLWANAKNTSSFTVKSSDIDDFSGNTYTYADENGKIKTEEIPQEVKVFYNGVFAEATDKYIPKSGDITFIDTDDDGKCDILKIREPKFVIVQSVSEEEIIYDKYNPDYNITFGSDGYDNFEIIGSDGVEIEISSIKAGSILEVEASESVVNKYCKITVIDNVLTAKISSIHNGESGYDAVVADGKEYDLTYRFNELLNDSSIREPSLNEVYTLYLNSYEEVVLIESETDGIYRTGYIKKMLPDPSTGDEVVFVDLLDSTGVDEKYKLADRVKLGNSSYKSTDVASRVDLDRYNDNVCQYVININGEISEIYIPEDNTDKISEVYSREDAYLYNYQVGYTFGANNSSTTREQACSIASNAPVFFVPEKVQGQSDEYFTVVKASEMKRYIKYNITIYNTSDEIGWGDFALVRRAIPFMKVQSIKPVMINKITSYYDSEAGEVYQNIEGIQNGEGVNIRAKDCRADKSVFPLTSGDIAFLMTDADGVLRIKDAAAEKSYDLLLDYQKGGQNAFTTSNGRVNAYSPTYYRNINGSARITYGAVYKTEGNMLWINPSEDISNDSLVEAFDCSKATVYKYNEKEEAFEKITVNQAIGYEHDTLEYNNVFMFTSDANFALAAIY